MSYETRRLEVYQRAKGYRLKIFEDARKAKEQGKILVVGSMNFPKDVLAGLGHFEFLGGEPYAVSVVREGEPGLALRCLEEVERRGYMRDMCSYMRVFWGSMFLDHSPWGSFPRPDFLISYTACESRSKWFQAAAEYLDVPHFSLDLGFVDDEPKLEYKEHHVRYVLEQLNGLIEWLEKFTGRAYEDELLVKAVVNRHRSRCLLAEICQLNAAVPAPMSTQLWLPFFMFNEWVPHKQETVDILTELRDEVKYRVDQGIAATPMEQRRVTHEGMPPWYALYLFSYLRDRGVAVVGAGMYTHFLIPVLQPTPEGAFDLSAPINWAGAPTNRGEALRYVAEAEVLSDKYALDPRVKLMVLGAAARTWKCDGVIMEFDRGCELMSASIMEIKAGLQKMGLPTMLYEANRVDEREWSWPHVQDSVDTFLEALGLPRQSR